MPTSSSSASSFVSPASRLACQKEPGDHKELLARLANGDRNAALPIVIKHGAAIFPELTRLLMTHPRDDNQSLIIFALTEIMRDLGPKAKEAIPVLATLLRSQDRTVSQRCRARLGYIGSAATGDVVKSLKKLDGEPGSNQRRPRPASDRPRAKTALPRSW